MIDGIPFGSTATIGVLGLLLAWVQYQSSKNVAYNRERIMRERFENIPHERDLWPDRKLVFSEPRVRTWGFRRWLWSLLPFTKPANYTQFNFRVLYPQDKYTAFHTEPVEPPAPDPENLTSNEKLRGFNVFHVDIDTYPASFGDGDSKVVINPTTDYRLFIDSVDPDRVGNVIESLNPVIEEMQRDDGEELIDVVGRPMSKSDFKRLSTE